MRASSSPPLRLAIVGAGPVGLALAVAASQAFPDLHLHLFDGRPLDKDLSGDPRTLALSLGSVQWLRQLQGLDEKRLQIISQVHVSQQSPSLSALPPWLPRPPWGAAGFQDPTVCIRAASKACPCWARF